MKRQDHMNRRNHLVSLMIAAALALLSAGCSSGGDGDADGGAATSGGGGSASATTTAPKPVDAVLLPAEGPLQAGTYAVPGFEPLLTMDLGAGWTVVGRTGGAITLAYEFDPEGRELARLNIGEVTGTFAAPFVPPQTMQSPALQQAAVRPLPAGGLHAALRGLPGVTVTDPTEVELGAVQGRRFTVRVGDLPAEAKEKCPQIPAGCVAAYDLPGFLAAVFPGGTTHDITTFEFEGASYLAAVNAPLMTSAPAGFEDAAQAVIRSLSFDRPVALDEAAALTVYADAIADPVLRPLARSVAAPGSPAATFMAALDDDAAWQLLAGNELPKRTATIEGGGFTISGGPGSETYDAVTYDDAGRVASFQVQGKPIAEFVAAIDDAEPVRVGPLQITPLETYRSFVSGRLWVPARIVNGAQPVSVDGLTVTHVAADGTSRPTIDAFDGLEVAPHWDAPFTFLFADAPLGGKLVFGGTIGGQPVEATFTLPSPSAG